MDRPALPKRVNLKGCGFNVTVAEDLIVFSEDGGVWGCRMRFSFQRKAGCWYVAIDGTDGTASVWKVMEAFRLVCLSYGDNFEMANGEYHL